MADETSWAVAFWAKYGWIETILLSSRYAVQHTLLICCCIDGVWSRWTPRFLTEDLKGMHLPPMTTLSLPTKLRREVEAMGRTSVFSAFSLHYIAVTLFHKDPNVKLTYGYTVSASLVLGYRLQRNCLKHLHTHTHTHTDRHMHTHTLTDMRLPAPFIPLWTHATVMHNQNHNKTESLHFHFLIILYKEEKRKRVPKAFNKEILPLNLNPSGLNRQPAGIK